MVVWDSGKEMGNVGNIVSRYYLYSLNIYLEPPYRAGFLGQWMIHKKYELYLLPESWDLIRDATPVS